MQPTKSGKQRITAERYTALSRVGTALMSELDESRLLQVNPLLLQKGTFFTSPPL